MKSEFTDHSRGAASVMQLAAWMDLACAILEALAAHAFRWNEPEYERFRQGLEESLKLLKSQPGPSAVLISAGTLSQRIEHYHENMRKSVDSSISELHDIIRVLLSSIEKVHHECSDSATALDEIKETIGNSTTAEELQVAKAHLTHALGHLAEKTRERRETISELVTNLQERVLTLDRSFPAGPARLSEGLPALCLKPGVQTGDGDEPPPVAQEAKKSRAVARTTTEPQQDPLTGLPNREAAEDTIVGLKGNAPGVFVAAFYVQRLEQINARLGDRTGNELLFLSAQRIVNALRPGDQVFRWRGPAFVGLLAREDAALDVRREVQRLVSSRFQFDLRGGAMIVSVGITGEVFAVEGRSGAELLHSLEQFFSQPSTRG